MVENNMRGSVNFMMMVLMDELLLLGMETMAGDDDNGWVAMIGLGKLKL